MLTGLADVSEGFRPTPVKVSPPRGFRSAEGLRSAWLSEEGPFGRGPTPLRGSAAQKTGIRYERKLQKLLLEQYGEPYLPSQWFGFLDRAGYRRWCQVDGILMGKEIVLFEIKLRGVSDAYFQLFQLYKPVVEKAFDLPVKGMVMLCRHFDPAVPFPEPPRILSSLTPEAMISPQWGVYTWRA